MYIPRTKLLDAFGESELYGKLLDEIEALQLKEKENGLDTIPLVEADSSLGFEPSMLYLTDRRHLEWKLRQIDFVVNTEMREGLAVHMRYLNGEWEGSQW